MAGLMLTSNHELNLPESEKKSDSGTARRLLLVRMPVVFSLEDDRDIKGQINAGVLNPELFFLTRLLYFADIF